MVPTPLYSTLLSALLYSPLVLSTFLEVTRHKIVPMIAPPQCSWSSYAPLIGSPFSTCSVFLETGQSRYEKNKMPGTRYFYIMENPKRQVEQIACYGNGLKLCITCNLIFTCSLYVCKCIHSYCRNCVSKFEQHQPLSVTWYF